MVVKKVLIGGNKLIEEETIRDRIQTEEGTLFDPEIITEDIRSLYRLGFFEDVTVDASGFEGGIAVIFTVKEKPLITRIDFEGNEEIKTQDFQDNIQMRPNTVVDEFENKRIADEVLNFLHEKGFYQAEVSYRLDPLGEDEYALVFVVDEGAKMKISKIEIIGNEVFSDRQIRKQMSTKESSLFTIFGGGDKLKSRLLEEDTLRILAFLYNNGHLQAKVDEPTIDIDREENRITVSVKVFEGPRFHIGELTAEGDEYFSAEEILRAMKSRPGNVFKRDVFAQDILAVTALYTDIGYALCRVDTKTTTGEEETLVNVAMVVNRGPLVTVGRVNITGNTITRDNVIRREVVLREGEIFSSKDLARTRQKIMNLGFFEQVKVTTEQRGADVINVNIDVVEKLTGAFTFGGGYSSEDKFGIMFRLTQDNLFGRGQKITASAEFSQLQTEYNLFFSDPSVFNSPYSAGFRVYNTSNDWDEYDQDSIGGQLIMGRIIGGYIKGSLTFKAEKVNIYNLVEDASWETLQQAGKSTTISTTLRLTRDARDNYFNPSRGSKLIFRGEYAGGFQGGDNNFYKSELDGVFYFPIFWKFVTSFHFDIGQVTGTDGDEVPIQERFYLGGINSIRGYEVRGVGPHDEFGNATGGFTKVVLNAEIIFPLAPSQNLNGVFFIDGGQAYDEGETIDTTLFRYSAGAGIRWLSPMGPIRVEYGYNLNPEEGDPKGQWQFSVGTAF